MLRTTSRLLARGAPGGLPLARGAVRSGLARVFGPPPFDPSRDPGDPGLLGPQSASWQIIGEPAAIVGGLRALLVQLLHPHALAGVVDHSAFRDDPIGRLQRTSAYVTTSTFGSTSEALAVARRVRGVHARVRGIAPDGRAYDAADPHLLGWVSIALASSFLAADTAFALRPVSDAVADAFVAEQSRVAALLDPRVDLDDLERDPAARAALGAGEMALPMVVEGTLPTSRAALSQRLADYAGELGVDDRGAEALRFLLWPNLPASMKAGYLPLAGGAVATLDPWQRDVLGLPTNRLASWPLLLQARAMLTALRLTTGVSPAPTPRWPAHDGAGRPNRPSGGHPHRRSAGRCRRRGRSP